MPLIKNYLCLQTEITTTLEGNSARVSSEESGIDGPRLHDSLSSPFSRLPSLPFASTGFKQTEGERGASKATNRIDVFLLLSLVLIKRPRVSHSPRDHAGHLGPGDENNSIEYFGRANRLIEFKIRFAQNQ